MVDVLSDDDEDDTGAVPMPNRRRSVSKKAQARTAGSKRKNAHVVPIPLCFKEAEGGYQKYKLPAAKRVYRRREYSYTDEDKVGTIVPAKPDPPKLFCDKFIFTGQDVHVAGASDRGGHDQAAQAPATHRGAHRAVDLQLLHVHEA
jgi:hypothetical protein